MDETTGVWTYFAVFGALVAAGIGFPIPEELPVITAGALAAHASVQVPREHPFWYLIWPLCILGVVIADGLLYGVGRLGGPRLRNAQWFQKYFLPPAKQAEIEGKFHKYGIKILLGARFLPGIRAPIFITAGIVRMPLAMFLLADGIYAVPGVSLLFFLSFWFTDWVKAMFGQVQDWVDFVRGPLLIMAVIVVGVYFLRAHLRRSKRTGDPHEVPIIGQMDEVPLIGKLVQPATVDPVPPPVKITPPPGEAAAERKFCPPVNPASRSR